MRQEDSPKCSVCKTGVCFVVGSRLANALGVEHHKCDKCGATFATKPESGKPVIHVRRRHKYPPL